MTATAMMSASSTMTTTTLTAGDPMNDKETTTTTYDATTTLTDDANSVYERAAGVVLELTGEPGHPDHFRPCPFAGAATSPLAGGNFSRSHMRMRAWRAARRGRA